MRFALGVCDNCAVCGDTVFFRHSRHTLASAATAFRCAESSAAEARIACDDEVNFHFATTLPRFPRKKLLLTGRQAPSLPGLCLDPTTAVINSPKTLVLLLALGLHF